MSRWVTTTVADLRREPKDNAERVSQLILFSPCQELEYHEGWWKVQGPDGYQGWIKESLTAPGEPPLPRWKVWVPVVVVRDEKTGRVLGRMPLDARFSGDTGPQGLRITWLDGRVGQVPHEAVRAHHEEGTLADLLSLARELVGVPYLWGGTSPFGFDCSGLIQRLFHVVFNRWLPRDSQDQKECGKKILRLEDLQPGDVLCFPGHVGLWLGQGEMLHASGREHKVAVTRLLPPEGPYGEWLVAKFLWGVRLRG